MTAGVRRFRPSSQALQHDLQKNVRVLHFLLDFRRILMYREIGSRPSQLYAII